MLWYFSALRQRVDISIEEILAATTKNGKYKTAIAASDLLSGPLSEVSTVAVLPPLDDIRLSLGKATASLLDVMTTNRTARVKLIEFADCYLHALQAADVSFADVARSNLTKVQGRFLTPDPSTLPTFDDKFPEDERIPSEIEIIIKERKSGLSCLQWNGIFIGDPLTDNIRDPDG